MASQRSHPLNELSQSLFSKHFFLRVFRIRESVGIHHQDVSFVEMESPGFIRREVEHPQNMSIRDQLFRHPGSRAEQIGGIMSRADESPCALRVQQEQEERDELERQRFFAKELVYPIQDFLRVRP